MPGYTHLLKVSDSGLASDQSISSFSTAERCHAASQVEAAEENGTCSCFDAHNVLCINTSRTFPLQNKDRSLASFALASGKDFAAYWNILEHHHPETNWPPKAPSVRSCPASDLQRRSMPLLAQELLGTVEGQSICSFKGMRLRAFVMQKGIRRKA